MICWRCRQPSFTSGANLCWLCLLISDGEKERRELDPTQAGEGREERKKRKGGEGGQKKHKETRGKSPDEPGSLAGQAEVGQAGVAL